ncbi:hypothetical protein [Aquabacter spiritensis]|uniref:Mrp family chromosome partitioning ATPase n=1 Tax=Aquabacter spiritensis TaxID=933073 RepID=A0A4R3LL02_9HYPH|nr:hypothetical protein [Aquabacter spiritensis]TCT00953.1 hypothetical protein EDC64_12040 [Aquabacter spiritensis]
MQSGSARHHVLRLPLRERLAAPARLLLVIWLLFALLVASLILPSRYSAQGTLAFDIATQPAPATVRGIIQVLRSRELAAAVLDRLAPADVARLAARDRGLFPPAWLVPDGAPQRERAAAQLADDLTVTPQHGGRTLDLVVSADRADIAARAVAAYLSAFTALQAGARESAPSGSEALPALRAGPPPVSSAIRDLPPWQLTTALVALAGALALLTVHLQGRPAGRGDAARDPLPQQVPSHRSVAWLDACDGAGLAPDEAIGRIAAHARALPPMGSGEARLIVVTAETPSDISALCAIRLARHLAEDSRVALVALDGASGELASLISDPWAPGMAEMLFGVAGFGETIHRDPLSRAHVIPPGRHARGGPSVVAAERLILILNALRQTYDFVVVAAPVLHGTAGAARLAPLDPLVACVEEADEAPVNVEAYDALAAQGISHVLMLRMHAPADRDDSPLPTSVVA